ncbi:Hypothetical protein, putative, partial [Bodo saltans]
MPAGFALGEEEGDAPPVFSVGRRRQAQSKSDNYSQAAASPTTSSLEGSTHNQGNPIIFTSPSPPRSRFEATSTTTADQNNNASYATANHSSYSPPLRGDFNAGFKPFVTPKQPNLTVSDAGGENVRSGRGATSFLIPAGHEAQLPGGGSGAEDFAHSETFGAGDDNTAAAALRPIGSFVVVKNLDDFCMDSGSDSSSDEGGDFGRSGGGGGKIPASYSPLLAGSGKGGRKGVSSLFAAMPTLGEGNRGPLAPGDGVGGGTDMNSGSFSNTAPTTASVSGGGAGHSSSGGGATTGSNPARSMMGNLPVVSIDLSKSVAALHHQKAQQQHQHQRRQAPATVGGQPQQHQNQNKIMTGGEPQHPRQSRYFSGVTSPTGTGSTAANNVNNIGSSSSSSTRHSTQRGSQSGISDARSTSVSGSPTSVRCYFKSFNNIGGTTTSFEGDYSYEGGGGGYSRDRSADSRRGTSASAGGGTAVGGEVRGRALQQKIAEMERREQSLIKSQRRQAEALERKVFYGEHRNLQKFVSWLTYCSHAAIASTMLDILGKWRANKLKRERRKGVNPLVALRLRQALRRARTRIQGRGVPRPTIAALRADKLLNLFPDPQLQYAIDRMTLKYFFENENIIMMGSEDD